MEASTLRQELVSGIEALGRSARPEQVDALLLLASRVEQWGKRMNLTGHRTVAEIVRRLVLDAVALLEASPPFDSLVDLGSGAGFPGLPIAILEPDVRVTLVDSRERRHHFQRAIRRELGLENVIPIRGRVEELEPVLHQAVLAQALARPLQAVDWMRRWAEPSGWLLIPSSVDGPELPGAEGLGSAEIRRYAAPAGPPRRLWVGRLP